MVLFNRVCKFLGRLQSVSAAVDYLARGCQNLGSHGGANVNGRSKLLPKH